MALATGSQHMNLLAPAKRRGERGCGRAGGAGSACCRADRRPRTIALAAADAAQFAAGQIVAVDTDYTGQTGFVGAPVAGAYVRQPLTDVDYIRRVTFNVALVSRWAERAHACGAVAGRRPAAGAKVQAVSGFVDREGGSFYQEWSALFVMEGSQGERIFFHYPRLQSMKSAEEAALPLAAKDKGKLERIALNAQFVALPVTDPLDGERVVCYRSFVPAKNALV